MGSDPTEPRDRLATYLRRTYGHGHASKLLASDIACTPKAAENILGGHWPNSRHWAAIVRRFGRDVLDAVFSPEIDEVTARLNEEVRQLEEQLQRKRAMARQIGGHMDRRSPGMAHDAGQAAGLRRRSTDWPEARP